MISMATGPQDILIDIDIFTPPPIENISRLPLKLFKKICILYGVPCEMDFLHNEWDSETSGEISISHGKP